MFCCVVCRFLPHMVMMFPYSGHFPAEFNFSGSNTFAQSSDAVVNSFYISHSSVNNRTFASLHVKLDSPGFSSTQFTTQC